MATFSSMQHENFEYLLIDGRPRLPPEVTKLLHLTPISFTAASIHFGTSPNIILSINKHWSHTATIYVPFEAAITDFFALRLQQNPSSAALLLQMRHMEYQSHMDINLVSMQMQKNLNPGTTNAKFSIQRTILPKK